MTSFFDGKRIAFEKFEELKKRVGELKEKGITPKLVSILVGEDAGSKLYLSLKKKAAEKAGAILEIKKFRESDSINQLIKLIEELNLDMNVHGIMIQLPLPLGFSRGDREKIVSAIDPKKDVDGMREDSPFIAPVVRATLWVLESAMNIMRRPLKEAPFKVAVVGVSGFVGSKIIKALKSFGTDSECKFEILGCNTKTDNLSMKTKSADIVISATGVEGIIKADMVKAGSILIDVGSPKGDIEKAAYEKAGFVSPVPGGIGPMTVYYLLENLVEATGSSLN